MKNKKLVKKDHEIEKLYKTVFKLVICHDFWESVRLEVPNFTVRLEFPSFFSKLIRKFLC